MSLSQHSRLRAVVLPPTAWRPAREAFRPGNGPDPLEVFRHLADNGIDISVIDPGKRPLNPLAGRGTVLESLDPLRALRVLTGHRRADIVVSVFEGSALPIMLLRRLAWFKVPVVLWDIGLTEGWRLREHILDRVVPSASQKVYIERRWGHSGVEVLGHGVDTKFFTPALPAPNGPVLAVGDDAGRDYASLLAVAANLGSDIVIRTGRLPADAPVAANVTILRDRTSDLSLRNLYAESRFVVVPLHPTLNASGVTSILEAAAMGRAAVVSDNPAIRDFIVPDVTCLVVPCGDRMALQTAMARLLREPETCAYLAENARRFVMKNCAQAVVAERFAALLQQYGYSGHSRNGDSS
jgi:glycosyltransferase involved in cell wall biosynthesis